MNMKNMRHGAIRCRRESGGAVGTVTPSGGRVGESGARRTLGVRCTCVKMKTALLNEYAERAECRQTNCD